MILGEKYNSYENALIMLDHFRCTEKMLCLTFAKRSAKHPKMKQMFPLNEKTNDMDTRNPGKYKVQHAFTDRLKDSPLIFMQNLLNENEG